jgi:hypothetical protein
MVTPIDHSADPRYNVHPGEGYDGVVLVTSEWYYATGALLYDGRAILTSAHLFEDREGKATVTFETPSGTKTLTAKEILIHPEYDRYCTNDLALLWLSEPPPVDANRYELYRNSDEVGQVFTMVGYGLTGTGSMGAIYSASIPHIRLKVKNRFDADASKLKDLLGSTIDWNPKAGTQLIADFDNGREANDALGQLIHCSDLGLGLDEGFVAPGDSGSPAFLQGKIAGVATYVASLYYDGINPDIDHIINSSFGEIAGWQRVSAYQQWIDQSLRLHYPNAPSKPEEVKKVVLEGNSGTTYVYFLVQFIGERSNPNEIVSVDYATRDGTAKAGSDYIPVSGRLNLYPGENHAAIPVEIIGDTIPEPDEYFYLDIFNPVGGSFGEGVVKLTAVRTIIDDDGWVG